MLSLVGVLLAGLVFTFRNPIAVALNLLDRPDGRRKLHAAVTPKVGSLAFIFTLGAVLLDQTGSGWPKDFHVYYLLAVIAFQFVIGFCDDAMQLSALARFVLSVLVCGFMFYFNGDFVVHQLVFSNGTVWHLGQTSGFAMTVLGLVFFVYAVNLMDGRNGILGLSAIAWLLTLQIAGLGMPMPELLAILATFVLFLAFNLSGKVFAGDAGAYVVGSAAGLGALVLTRGGTQPLVYMDQILVWFALPLFDACRVLIGRVVRGLSPFDPGAEHFHHLLWRAFGANYGLLVYIGMVAVPSALTIASPGSSLFILAGTLALFALLILWTASIGMPREAGEPVRSRLPDTIPAAK